MRMIAVAMLLALWYGCTTGNSTTTAHPAKDTVVLYKTDTSIVTGITASHGVLHLPAVETGDFSLNTKILLLLTGPKVITAPEGVYELYLTHSLKENDKLSSSQSSFVSLLDLYSFTAPGAKQQVEMDITLQVKNLYSTGKLTPPLFAILKFAPVRLADGTFSVNAGKISFSGISVIKVNE